MNSTFYFILNLTSDEHSIVESRLKTFCVSNNCELLYYRKLKTGHVPMKREIKVQFGNRGLFMRYMDEQDLWKHAMRWEKGELVPWKS